MSRSDDQLDYRTILDQVPAIVYVVEAGGEGRWRYVNEWVQLILGYTVAEWLARPGWEGLVHPVDRERVWQPAREMERRTSAEPYLEDYRLLHRDGHGVWIRDSSKLVTDTDGTLCWYGVLQDISALKAGEAELERQSAAQAAVAALGEHALERVSIDQLLSEACRAAARVLETSAAVVIELDAEQRLLTLRASHGVAAGRAPASTPWVPETQVGVTLSSGRPSVIEDWDAESTLTKSAPLRALGIDSSVYVRIEGPEEPWGCFGVLCDRPRAFSGPDVSFIQSLANVLADAIERQRIEDAFEHRSLHDPLTGLPNRTLLRDRLEQAVERLQRHSESVVAVLFIDLDHLKAINDALGHKLGDELLVAVGQRLRDAVRPSDTVARLSGDEFVVLLEEIHSERDAIMAAQRIAEGFMRALTLGSDTRVVTASIGIALADAHATATEILENADTAMYRAKERGRARYELFA